MDIYTILFHGIFSLTRCYLSYSYWAIVCETMKFTLWVRMAMAEYPSYPLPTSEGFSHEQAGRAACYRQLMDIIYFHLALRVEESFSTRVLQTLCSLRIYIILGLAPWRIYNGNSNAFGCLFYSFTSTLGTISGLTESAASLISNHLCNRDFIFHSKFRWLIGRLFFLSCTIAQ